jgi:putative methyltransferase (TIGR04325 family)
LKAVVRSLAPPIVVPLLRRLRDAVRGGRSYPDWEYVPEGWRGAIANRGVKGWNVAAAREAHRRQWERWLRALKGPGPLGVDFFRPFRADLREGEMPRDFPWAHNATMAYAYVLTLAAGGRKRLSMLDWGGGIGQFYPLSRALLPGVEIDYHCKDVPELADCGRELSPDAHFYADDSVWTRRTYDLVLASSALHCIEDWQGTLRRLAAATGDLLFVTRLPTVTECPSFVVLQRAYSYGFETEFLAWFVNRNEFLAAVAGCGLRLVREFVLMDSTPVRDAPEQAAYRGFLFRKA